MTERLLNAHKSIWMNIIRFLSFMSCYSSFISFYFFLSEFSFSLLHAYFCMILINVFLIPCNQTVHLITFHMSFYICWSVSRINCDVENCIWILAWAWNCELRSNMQHHQQILWRLEAGKYPENANLSWNILKDGNQKLPLVVGGWSRAVPSSRLSNFYMFWFLFSVHMVVILYVKSP